MHALIYPLGVFNTTAFQEIISLAYTCKLQQIYYIAIYNKDGETPLMVARHNGHDACVALLIEAMGQHVSMQPLWSQRAPRTSAGGLRKAVRRCIAAGLVTSKFSNIKLHNVA